MDLHPCKAARDACGCSTDVDLRAPARRGLFFASVLCAIAASAAGQLAFRATDDVHRAMFGMLLVALGVAALVLQIVRISLRPRARVT